MSDHFLHIFPVERFLLPPKAARDAAFDLVQELFPKGQEFGLEADELPIFISDSELDVVRCPACGEEIMDWWGEEISRWVKDRAAVDCTTPCCGTATSIDRVDYDPPQDFVRFRIEIMRPGRLIEAADVEAIARALGAPVRYRWIRV
jgi:hypothetical protein